MTEKNWKHAENDLPWSEVSNYVQGLLLTFYVSGSNFVTFGPILLNWQLIDTS